MYILARSFLFDNSLDCNLFFAKQLDTWCMLKSP